MNKFLQTPTAIKLAGLAMLIHAASATAAPMYPAEAGNYLNGGVGLDARQAMHAERAHYNLRLRFAQARTGEYLSGVGVIIEPLGKKGAFMRYEDAGPLLYVRLHPGSYRIRAVFEGRRQLRTVVVGKSATERVIYWP